MVDGRVVVILASKFPKDSYVRGSCPRANFPRCSFPIISNI